MFYPESPTAGGPGPSPDLLAARSAAELWAERVNPVDWTCCTWVADWITDDRLATPAAGIGIGLFAALVLAAIGAALIWALRTPGHRIGQ
jgi:hypothetical protein